MDYRAFALARAKALSVFTSAPTVFEDPFTEKIGANASQWKSTPVGSGVVSILTDVPGGVARLDTGATASSFSQAFLGAGTDLPSVLPDITAGARWYLLWSFRIPTTINGQAAAYLVISKAAAGGTNDIYIGADGPFVGTTKFMVEDDIVAGVTSSVNINTGWNYVEAWQVGTAREIKFAFNGETPLTFTAGADIGGQAKIYIAVSNGTTAATQKLDLDHLVVLMPGNVALPGT